jgi:hypothetical protein
LFEAESRRVLGWVEYDPRFGVDRLASAVLDFGTGTGTFTCSTQLAPFQQVQILGTEGRVELSEVEGGRPVSCCPARCCGAQHRVCGSGTSGAGTRAGAGAQIPRRTSSPSMARMG